MSEDRLSAELLSLVGERDFLRLVESYGGTRVFVPASGDTTQLAKRLGKAPAEILAARFAGTYIRVPLARERRARQYREQEGMSNAAIARRLGITETGVDKLFSRMTDRPIKGRDPRQADLFSSN